MLELMVASTALLHVLVRINVNHVHASWPAGHSSLSVSRQRTCVHPIYIRSILNWYLRALRTAVITAHARKVARVDTGARDILHGNMARV